MLFYGLALLCGLALVVILALVLMAGVVQRGVERAAEIVRAAERSER